MDNDSPFRNVKSISPYAKPLGRDIYVNYCDDCHYVWKAPTLAEKCVNCNNSPVPPIMLVKYRTDVPII